MSTVLVWVILGAACGMMSALSLEWTVVRLEPGRGWAVQIVLGMLLRWAAAAVLLVFAVRTDWTAGLAAAAGFILAGRALLAYRAERI